ncbi:MAG: hypothetical protein HYS27_06370 [Deltaproteobacteria bacterium]|nr:hypothetical protein [Deltaproteobacteria bacterium]
MPVALALMAAPLVASACATARLDDPPLALELVVVGLRPDERAELRERLCAVEGVSDCKMVEEAPPTSTPSKKKKKGKDDEPPPPPPPSREARYTFGYRGSLGELRWHIRELPHPGLEAQRAEVRLSYRGFDNKAPSIEVLEPAPNTVVTEPVVNVTVRIPDVDTAAVDIGEEDGKKDGDYYRAAVRELPEGESTITVKATDKAGNAATADITVTLDTTPPELEVEVQVPSYDKAVVRGKVKDAMKLTIDGREVPVDMFGNFQKEVAVDPDTSYTEVIAVDAHANVRKIRRSAKIASPLSADSK